jgi:hypothetical protein
MRKKFFGLWSRSVALRVLTGSLLLAASFARADTWSPPLQITNYFVWLHGAAYIGVSSSFNPDGCSAPTMLYLDTTQAEFKSAWAVVLSASATGSTVSVNVNGCAGGRPVVVAVASPAIW